MKKLWIFIGLFLAGCSMNPEITSYFYTDNVDISDLEESKKTTTVAMLLPLSNAWETTGKNFQNAALLALDENPNASLKLLFFDTQSSAEGTQEAYNTASSQNPDIILGPIFADEFKALPSPTLINKPVLGYTSDNTLLNSERASMAVLIPEQIRTIVRQNCQSGKYKLAVIGPENKMGEIVMNSLEEALQECPEMTLQSFALYDAKKADMSEDILKILPTFINPKKKNLTDKEKELLAIPMEERLKFDSLFVFEDGTKLTQVMSILAFYDVTPNLLPIYALANAKNIKDNSLNGVLMADLPTNNTFSTKYKNTFGKSPVRLASLAYDSIDWIAKKSTKEIVSLKTLRDSDTFHGMDGLVKLNSDGTNSRGLRIIKKTSKGIIEIAPAPTDLNDSAQKQSENNFKTTTESIDSALKSPLMSDKYPVDFQ